MRYWRGSGPYRKQSDCQSDLPIMGQEWRLNDGLKSGAWGRYVGQENFSIRRIKARCIKIERGGRKSAIVTNSQTIQGQSQKSFVFNFIIETKSCHGFKQVNPFCFCSVCCPDVLSWGRKVEKHWANKNYWPSVELISASVTVHQTH